MKESGSLSKTIKRHADLAAKEEIEKLRKELLLAEARADQALATIDRMRQAKKPRKLPAPVKNRSKKDIIEVVFSDVHGNQHDPAAMSALLSDLRSIRPDRIVINGDFINCGGFLAEHHTLGYVAETADSYEDDIEQANALLDQIIEFSGCTNIFYIEGNHECLHPDHEVLTQRGWVAIAEVSENDEVASLTPGGDVVWQTPLETHEYDFDGDMVVVDSEMVEGVMTPNHRIAFFNMSDSTLNYRRADSMLKINETAVAHIPVSGGSTNLDYNEVSDDEIRLAAWILAGKDFINGMTICQNNLGIASHVAALLDRLEAQYSKQESWLNRLSDRQFKVFLDELLLVNSEKTPAKQTTPNLLYGSKKFLSNIQKLCAVHGYQTTLKPRSCKDLSVSWSLRIAERRAAKTETGHYRFQKYSGKVYCLTTSQGNFFTRYNGTVYVTGNSRPERWVLTQKLAHKKDIEYLRRTHAPEYRLNLAERGIKYFRRDTIYEGCSVPGWIRLDNVYFTHQLGGGRQAALASLEKTGGNIIFSHTHRQDFMPLHKPALGLVAAWNPGCLCKRQPLYMHTHPTEWTHGYIIRCISQKTGHFQVVPISINNGISYGWMISRNQNQIEKSVKEEKQ